MKKVFSHAFKYFATLLKKIMTKNFVGLFRECIQITVNETIL